MLLYNLGKNLSEDELLILDKITNRNIGKPYCVNIEGRDIDFDYLQAAYEINTLYNTIPKYQLGSLLEIGAGYGRTCHSILCNYPNVEEYIILDLDTMMKYSKKYLKSVLSKKNYNKIKFIDIKKFHLLKDKMFDLIIQIDGFNEMEGEIVCHYLNYINSHSEYFYTKNPVGKYLDKTLDNHVLGTEMIQNALQSGLLTNILDIDNNLDIEKNGKEDFISTYKLSDKWKLLHSSWAKPIPFMWEAVYQRNND